MTFPQTDPTAPWPEPNPGQPTYGAGYSGAPAPAYPPPPGTNYPPPIVQPPPYGYYNPAAQTNTMAILSLVFAFVFAPLAIVFGHMARKQIRERGEGGSGLATAGLWCGYIFTGVQVLVCIGYIALVATVANNGSLS